MEQLKLKLLLSLGMILCTLYASAYDFMVDGIAYNINGSSATVTFTDNSDYYNNNYNGLTVASIPESVIYNGVTYTVKTIGDYAFSRCSSITNVTIPNSVTYIGNWAFFDCTGLTSVTIPNSVTSIGESTFRGCTSLTSVTIPNSVTSIGEYAFYKCSGLTSFDIPNAVTSIGSHAFLGCSGLSSITFPNSVTSIGDYAFINCGGLTDVYCYIANPSLVTTGFNIFSSGNNTQRTLHVPAGSLEAYQAYASWSNYFGNIVEMEPEAVLAESIKLNVTTAGLNEGATLQLTATVLPEGASSESVIWASNNPNVATVDSNGLVTTHSVGTVTITAMTTDGSNLSTSCTVTLLPVGVKGDVNGDSNINISDVTKLIDYLLSGTWN